MEIFDTAVKVGLGAAIAALSGFLLEMYRRNGERTREEQERFRDNVEKPLVAYIDEMLVLMSKAYWEKAERREPEIRQLLEAFRQKEAAVEARLAAMQNPALSKSFRDLDSAYSSFRAELAEGSLVEARSALKKAHSIAGEFFRALYSRS